MLCTLCVRVARRVFSWRAPVFPWPPSPTDYDFGVESLSARTRECIFPWLLSNVVDVLSGEPLANGKRFVVLDWEGHRVGIMGLIEKEWLDTLSTIAASEVRYTDFVTAGKELAVHLRTVEACDVVLALTHMRSPNDERLAASVPEIDCVLGGHDHDWVRRVPTAPCSRVVG
jgi:5'-nucleotidase